MIVKSSTGKKQCDFAKNNSFNKKKLYVVSIAIIIFIAIVITSIILCNDIGTTSPAIKTEENTVQSPAIKTKENTVQKNKRLGLHFSFKWGYLIDDLDQTEFKSFTPTGDYDRIFGYTLVTKNDYQYTILAEKSSRKITTIFSEDLATVKAFIKEVPNILESRNKVKDHEKASGYYLDCANDDVFLGVCKNDENKKTLVIKESIRNIDQYFNVVLDSF